MKQEDYESEVKKKFEDIFKSNLFMNDVKKTSDEYMQMAVKIVFDNSRGETLYKDDKVTAVKIEGLKLDDPVFVRLLALQVAIGTLTGNLIQGVSDGHPLVIVNLLGNCAERFIECMQKGITDSMLHQANFSETE